MSESKFVPGEKVKISDLETINYLFEEDRRTHLVDKWAGCILTFYRQREKCVYTEEADTTFHEDLVEKVRFHLPEELFEM